MLRYFAIIVCSVYGQLEAQTTPHFTIEFPASVASEHVYVNYCLYGEGAFCSWVEAKANQTSYKIEGTREGRPVTSLKAILYAPGCAMEALELNLTQPAHAFTCRALPVVTLRGEVVRVEDFQNRQLEFRATYMAGWAQRFFGIADGAVPSIPVGAPAQLTADHRFEFTVPDFASDALTADGTMHVWMREKFTDRLLALMVPEGSRSKIDNLRVQSRYAGDLVFAPCAVNAAVTHLKTGFAVRQPETCGK